MGMTKSYPVFLDQSAIGKELIFVNAGKKGILVGLNPQDLIENLLKAKPEKKLSRLSCVAS